MKNKIIKENDICPSCHSGNMGKIPNQLHCNNCGLIANQIGESEFYEVKDISNYLLT